MDTLLANLEEATDLAEFEQNIELVESDEDEVKVRPPWMQSRALPAGYRFSMGRYLACALSS